jgi:hypothetical protein
MSQAEKTNTTNPSRRALLAGTCGCRSGSGRRHRRRRAREEKSLLRLVQPATPSPATRARADEIIEAYDRLWKRYMRKPRGYRAAERANDAVQSGARARTH